MTKIAVETIIDAPVDVVWEVVEPIESHAEWMHDAESVAIVSEQTRGVGTRFEARTKVGPIRLTDQMEITEWEPGRVMGVRHVGLVTGTGRLTLEPAGENRTRFSWREELTFPWWMAGRVGGAIGGPVLKRIWNQNLADLRASVDEHTRGG